MTRQDVIARLEARGCEDVWFMSQPCDAGGRIGFGLSFHHGGEICRTAVRMPADSQEEAAYPLLLEWALELTVPTHSEPLP